MAPRVLVVDDEDAIRRLHVRALRVDGHDLSEASSAAEARRALAARSIDLVLSDVTMPGESGIELARWILVEHPDVAVVMVTGVDDPEVARIALDGGASGYLIKPVSSSQLRIVVANALRQRQLEIERRGYEERLERTVHERTAELRQSREETIRRLASAAEFRDDDTGHHIERMSRYAAMLARRSGLPDDRVEAIRIASPMHDVGKIGIPDAILNKPGRLTEDEFRVMRTHAEIGWRILSGSESALLELAATIAISHHEKVDGTGYPRGLSGDAIPLEGRICAVADVFDALTSPRVYKPAFSIEKAVAILVEGRGRHFQADLVDLLVAGMDEVIQIRARYGDDPGPS